MSATLRLRPPPLGCSSQDDLGRRAAVGCSASAVSKMERGNGIFLRASRDIETVKRHGRRISTELFNLLLYSKMGDGPTRVGIVVGKRFGNAVRRNRAKRIFRDLIRQSHRDLVLGQTLLVFPKREALLRPFDVLTTKWQSTLRQANVMRSRAE